MRQILLRGVLGVLFLVTGLSAYAQVAQTPLIVGGASVPPNLVFTFDDSGSMAFECLPESLCIGNEYVGAMPGGIATFKTGVATTTNNNLFNRQMRSVATNAQYYDPAVTYTPWLKSDGSTYPSYTATAAPIDPRTPGTTINLVSTQTFTTNFCTGPSTCNNASQSFYPAQYWRLISGTGTAVGNFTVTFITGTASTTFTKDAARTDCAGATTCTLAEEQKNFSNWFTYYRNKLLSAIGGTAGAFYNLPVSYRLGYGRINQDANNTIDGVNTNTLERGLRSFTGTDRDSFYTWLFALQVDAGGTPLRRAMGDVGEYYKRADNRGPWSNTPGTTDATAHLTCRRAFHLLMTDGSWNGAGASNASATGNVDNTNVTTAITGPNSQSYVYNRAYPYRDGNSDTLADVAMYYWRTDLRTDLTNDVKASATNPAFWQHMVNYTIGFGVNGNLVNPDDLPALTNNTKSWGSPATDANNKVDDLWHAAINSRGLSLSAGDQVAYANALRAVITNIDERNGSDAGVAVSGRFLTSNSRKYVPAYRTNVWTGDVSAIALDSNGVAGATVWSAASSLPAAAARNIFTYKDGSTRSVSFTWAALTAAGMTSSLAVTAPEGTGLVAYLRGDPAGEGSTYRARPTKLGDIVNSSPAFVQAGLNMAYDFLPITVGASGTVTAANTYRTFLRNKALRFGNVYVGANDGMFHVFSDVNGTETFAFIPKAVLGDLKKLSVTPYDHEYYVDGPVVEADVHDTSLGSYGGWRNIVVGGGGAGAKNLFAINAPVPSSPTTSGTINLVNLSPGPGDILWEVSSTSSTTFAEMGYMLQTPEVGIMRDGQWAVIVGNGYESASGRAQLFIINALTGALIKRIDTGIPTSGGGNGLGGVRVVRDVSRQIVAAYAGDLRGNLWKFDLSGNTAASWVVAYGSTSASPKPLFSAVNRNGQAEPMTAAPAIALHPNGGILVMAGTGKLFEAADTNNTQERTLYGLWDKAPLGATSATATLVISGTSTLVLQTLTSLTTVINVGTATATQTAYTVSDNAVDYTTKNGWRIPLTILPGQRMVYDPQNISSLILFETVVPGAAVSTCTASSGVGFNLILNPFTGGLPGIPIFDTNLDGVIDGSDDKLVIAYQTGADGSDAIISKGGGAGAASNPNNVVLDGNGNIVATPPGGGGGDGRCSVLESSSSSTLTCGGANSIRRTWKQILTPPP